MSDDDEKLAPVIKMAEVSNKAEHHSCSDMLRGALRNIEEGNVDPTSGIVIFANRITGDYEYYLAGVNAMEMLGLMEATSEAMKKDHGFR